MDYSKKCTFSQLRGYIGESYVQYRLCKAGCSVNSLVASDFGIDLHVQLPDLGNDWVVAEAIRDKKRGIWSMLPEFVHIQVKFKGEGAVLVPSNEVQEWVATSRTGLPTFLFLVKEAENGNEEVRYFDPSQMRSMLNGIDSEESIRFEYEDGSVFDDNLILVEMLLFARYPLLMQSFSATPADYDDMNKMINDFILQVGIGEFIDKDAGDYNESTDWCSTSAYAAMEGIVEFAVALDHPMIQDSICVDNFFSADSEFERLYCNIPHGYFPRREGEYSSLLPEYFASPYGGCENALMGLIRGWELKDQLDIS